ncbi:MAG: preprotein translocase subunit YajC [Myxococcota bacterium]|jgi:preprotein translocase subunit YajC
MESLIPFLLIGGVFYFLIIRPQMQERQEHDDLLKGLAKDDQVVMANGLHGRIVRVEESTVVLEVADRTRVTFDKAAVQRRADATPAS